MSDLISREVLNDSLYSCEELKGRRVIEAVANTIKEQPTVEAVPKSYADQIRWERDIAVEQLNEIGCQFGQKMDEVKKQLGVVHGGWKEATPKGVHSWSKGYARCSACDETIWSGWEMNFCPNCGADMRTSAE